MTYAAARARIVAIVEGATPTISAGGLPKSFKEFADAGADNQPGGRGFTLFAVADDVRTPLFRRSLQRRVAAVELRVFYPLLRGRKDLDLVLRADHKTIADALLDTSAWQTETSSIQTVEGAIASPLAMHADVDIGPESVAHVYRFDLEYVS